MGCPHQLCGPIRVSELLYIGQKFRILIRAHQVITAITSRVNSMYQLLLGATQNATALVAFAHLELEVSFSNYCEMLAT